MAEDNSLAQTLAGLGGKQSMGLMVAIAGIIALLAGMWMWGQAPEYRVLYSNLSDRDGGAIIESLQQLNVPYKFSEGGGALLVPANQVHEMRLRLASQGLPKGSLAGFELMENQKFGTSQFLEQVNYQRALEGELARSMQTLAQVQSARVHLALPKPSVFVKEQLKPSASVVLMLHPGRTLDSGQINGIIHLISSSVPDMPAKNVTVVDQSGSLLSSAKEGGTELLDASQLKYVRQIEQDYIKRIEDIVTPLVGANNVHAQITADIDFAQTEQTAEIYKPNQNPKESTLRSQQSMESVNGSGQNAAGVPGALSNQPPVPATAPIVAPASAVGIASGMVNSNLHKESTVNYEVDRTISHTKLPVGRIKRLSVAVVVNNRTFTDKDGKTGSKPLSESEKDQITALVKEAMGFNANRNDSLNVLNSAFNEEKVAPTPEIPVWKQPEVITLAKDVLKYLLIAGIGLFLLFGVIRPAFRNFMAASEKEKKEESEAQHPVVHELSEAERTALSFETSLQAVKQMAKDEPKIVATVVKEWVSK